MFRSLWSPDAARRSPGLGRILLCDAQLAEKVALDGLTPEHMGLLHAWRAECRDALPVLEGLASDPALRLVFARFLESILSGSFDDAHVACCRAIGLVRRRSGPVESWINSACTMIARELEAAVESAGASVEELGEFSEALGRVLRLDRALVVDASSQLGPGGAVQEADEAPSIERIATSRATSLLLQRVLALRAKGSN